MVVGYGISGASRSDSCSRRLRDSAELRLFVLSRRVANCQPGTIDTYCQRIGGLLDFAKKPATEITKADIELYLISLKEKQRSPHYIKGIYRNLRVFFDWMVREEMLQRSPLHRNIPVPKVSRRGKEFLSREDFDRLLAACPANDFRGARNIAWLWLLWTTGCRFDGLAKLKLKDLEWTENRISVVEKGDKHRYAPFTGDAQRAVYRYLKARKVFMGAKDDYQELWINEEAAAAGEDGPPEGDTGKRSPASQRAGWDPTTAERVPIIQQPSIAALCGMPGLRLFSFLMQWDSDDEFRDVASRYSFS